MRDIVTIGLAAIIASVAGPSSAQNSIGIEDLLGRPPASSSQAPGRLPFLAGQERGSGTGTADGGRVYPYGGMGRRGLDSLFGSAPPPGSRAPGENWAPIGGVRVTPDMPGSGDADDGENTARVIGGTQVAAGELPWQVQLIVKASRGESLCGGTVIAPNWVLTAAHCLTGENGRVTAPEQVTVYHGHTRNRQGAAVGVVAVHRHEGYRQNLDARNGTLLPHDIALLELSQPVRQQPIALMTPTIEEALDQAQNTITTAQVSGWGLVSDQGPISPNLLKADLQVFHISDCIRSFRPQGLWEKHICSGMLTGDRASCRGDSGGPLAVRDRDGRSVQIGIVSFGSQRCEAANAPGVFTRVASYYDWIQATISGSGGPAGPGGPGGAPPRIAIQIDPGQRVALGSKVGFQVASERPGYLLMIDINAAADAALVFPNSYANRKVAIRPGEVIRIPEPSYGFDVRATEPIGPGLLFAVVSDQPFDPVRTVNSARTMARGFVAQAAPGGAATADALHKTALELIDELSTIFGPKDQTWSAAYLPYEIVR